VFEELIEKIEQLKYRLEDEVRCEYCVDIIDEAIGIIKASKPPEFDSCIVSELITKVRQWWDDVYPADVFTGVSGDEGAVRVAEIRALLDRVEKRNEVIRCTGEALQ